MVDLSFAKPCPRSADWNFGRWAAVTDKVRGGVSTAELSPGADGAARPPEQETRNGLLGGSAFWWCSQFLPVLPEKARVKSGAEQIDTVVLGGGFKWF